MWAAAQDRLVVRALTATALLAAGAFCYAAVAHSFDYYLWADRDLLRSAEIWDDFPVSGAELSYAAGARTPGGFLHYLWALVLVVSSDPEVVYWSQVVMAAAAALILADGVRRTAGAVAGATTLAVYVTGMPLLHTLLQVWNPAVVPVFAAGAVWLVLHAGRTGRPWALVGSAALAALTAQLHLSGGFLLVAVLVAWLLSRPLRRWWVPAAAAGAIAVCFAPYLVAELATGFPNTRTILVAAPGPAPGAGLNWENLGGFLVLLAGDPTGLAGLHTPSWWLLLVAVSLPQLLLLPGAMLWLRRPWQGDAGTLGVAAMVTGSAVYFLLDWRIPLEHGEQRYLLVALHGVSVLAGVATGAVVARLQGTARAAAGAAVVASMALAAGSVAVLVNDRAARADTAYSIWTWRDFQTFFAMTADRTGWSMSDILANTSVVVNAPLDYDSRPGVWRPAQMGYAYPVWRATGSHDWRRTRGSLPAAGRRCAVFYWDKGGDALPAQVDREHLETLLGLPLGPVTDIASEPVGPGLLVLYRRPQGRCVTTFTNRYVLTPEERITYRAFQYRLFPDTAPGRAAGHRGDIATALTFPSSAPPPAEDVIARLLFPIGDAFCQAWCEQRAYILVQLRRSADGLVAELHSNQLRGLTYNPPFYNIVRLYAPRLELVDRETDERHVLELGAGRVGLAGALTPIISQPVAVPDGRYQARFHGAMVGGSGGRQWRPDPASRQAFSLTVAEELVIGP